MNTIDFRTEIEQVKYHELKAFLETKGLAEAWKSGKKKDDVIKDAVELFERYGKEALKNIPIRTLNEELGNVEFHNLEAYLTERGLEGAWEAGKSKDDVIKDAVTLRSEIIVLEKSGASKDTIEAKKASVAEDKVNKADNEAKDIVAKQDNELDKLKKKYTKDGVVDREYIEGDMKRLQGMAKSHERNPNIRKIYIAKLNLLDRILNKF